MIEKRGNSSNHWKMETAEEPNVIVQNAAQRRGAATNGLRYGRREK